MTLVEVCHLLHCKFVYCIVFCCFLVIFPLLGLYFSLIFLSSVERYNPQENRWHTVSPMGTRRKHLGCAVYQDMIYSVGGRDDTTELSSAERYNPRTNQWSPVVAMTSRRSGVSARSSLMR